MQDGIVAKLADDLYCGGNTPEELLCNWERVLKALSKCDLRLSASKTVVTPLTTTILGWVWNQGTLSASPHRIAPLSSCSPPETVRGLRSFIGAYKVLGRVLPHCSQSYPIWIMLPRGNNLLNVLHGLMNFFSVFVMLKSLSLTVRLSPYRALGTNYGLSLMDPFLNVVSAPHFIFPVTISCT